MGSNETSTYPTTEPTIFPTVDSTAEPTAFPTVDSTANSTAFPTVDSTADPTAEPTTVPTLETSFQPSITPSSIPTCNPSDSMATSSGSHSDDMGIIIAVVFIAIVFILGLMFWRFYSNKKQTSSHRQKLGDYTSAFHDDVSVSRVDTTDFSRKNEPGDRSNRFIIDDDISPASVNPMGHFDIDSPKRSPYNQSRNSS